MAPPTPAATGGSDDRSMADKPAASDAQSDAAASEKSPTDAFTRTQQILSGDVALLDRAVSLKDSRLAARVLRDINRVRRSIHPIAPKQPAAAATPRAQQPPPAAASPAPASHLAALFAVIASLEASPTPPHSLAHIRDSLVAKDDGAAQAWSEAQERRAAQRRSDETDSKQRADRDAMQLDGVEAKQQPDETSHTPAPQQPISSVEASVFVDVVYGVWLLDSDYYEDAARLFSSLVAQLASFNRRTLDGLSAKVYFYCALSYERWGEADEAEGGGAASRLSGLLPTLLASYRTCCLQHNEPGQATLINAILRAYLSSRQYALADTFRLKSAYPSDLRLIPAAVYARYCLYVGRIHAVQLAYSDAYSWLQQAKRKAPAGSGQAASFKYAVALLAIVTQLLMGEIPERSAFNDDSSEARQLAAVTALTRANSLANTKQRTQTTFTSANAGGSGAAPPALATAQPPATPAALSTGPSVQSRGASLYPYLCLTRAVRVGDLALFQSVSARFASTFARDDVASLIVRLRANVIKAGLRRINLSYSAIPLQLIEAKLRLDDTFQHDGEALVVKAISDGVIDATLDPNTAALHSTPTHTSYHSAQPQHALNKRIAFALSVHTDAVKALTYPHAASARAAATGEQYDDDDDDEDSLAALQRRERREKEKEAEKKRKEDDKSKDGKEGKEGKEGKKDDGKDKPKGGK